jgi:NAD(P)-dependent dehydrogenase (short-subunit alcohol dehydrogenase family)
MSQRPVVIVTGASRGIGAATTQALGASGAAVVMVARSAPALEEIAQLVKAAGGDAVVVEADVAHPDAPDRIVAAAEGTWGRIDAVVNNAATLEPMRRLHAVDVATWQQVLLLNVAAPAALTAAALPLLRLAKGRVISLSSTAAHLAIAGLGPYCVSKAALVHWTRVLAVEEPAVTALTVQPGTVDTGMHVTLRTDPEGALEAGRRELYQRLLTEDRLRPPAVPAKGIAWLALYAPLEWSGEDVTHDDPRIGGT